MAALLEPHVVGDMRRALITMKTLAQAGHLTPERFAHLTRVIEAGIEDFAAWAENSPASEPDEYFAVTPAGIAALGAPPVEREPRVYGSLRCIDGGLAAPDPIRREAAP